MKTGITGPQSPPVKQRRPAPEQYAIVEVNERGEVQGLRATHLGSKKHTLPRFNTESNPITVLETDVLEILANHGWSLLTVVADTFTTCRYNQLPDQADVLGNPAGLNSNEAGPRLGYFYLYLCRPLPDKEEERGVDYW